MKETLLKEIQETVMKYAGVIASVIDVDVEIVDNHLIRVAGTGVYQNQINQDMSMEGFVYRNILETGNHYIIEDPGDHFLCRHCHNKENCVEKMQVSMPIKMKEEIIGVMGLICSEEQQKIKFKENMDSYIAFLHQIVDLIGAKVFEYEESRKINSAVIFMEKVINSVDNGIVVINGNNQIIQINTNAESQLKIGQGALGEAVQILPTGESIMGKELYEVTICPGARCKKFNLVGELISVGEVSGEADRIFIFNQMKKIKSDAYNLMSGHEAVKAEVIIGDSEGIAGIKERIKKIADSKSTVLITGESGTGKELVARAIHSEGDRKLRPFIAVNCGAIPDALLESELFGYVKGAFTGANQNGKMGKFELANKGVLFLDEIGDMPLYLQVKLLRVLQERSFARIGSNKLIDLDIRVVAATNKDLRQLIGERKFREDLYYRLNVIPIEMPSLRQRGDDIELLTEKFITKYNRIFGKNIRGMEAKVWQNFRRYPWPGNIRELENMVECMVNLAEGTDIIAMDMFPKQFRDTFREMDEKQSEHQHRKEINQEDEIQDLKTVRQMHIRRALEKYGYTTEGKKQAAKKLGIGIATLYRNTAGHKEENLQ